MKLKYLVTVKCPTCGGRTDVTRKERKRQDPNVYCGYCYMNTKKLVRLFGK